MARKVDVSLISQLNAGAEGQEVKKGNRRTTDPNFPVFATPVNEDILVYIPKTNLVTTENGEDMKVLDVFIHDYKQGNGFGQMRCVNGLSGGIFEQLGYDGTCPACESMSDAWELYRRKLEAEAKKLGIDPQNDPTDILKSARQKIIGEMDMKGAEEYVTFPVVIIPTKGKMQPTEDAVDNLKVQFVTWRKKRYEENILGALDTLMTNPGHPAGMFWIWKFSYNTEGKQANARDSAKNAKYTPIVDSQALAFLGQYAPYCEKSAAGFTNDKATEVIVANQFMYQEDYADKVAKIMAKTRSLLEISEVGAAAQPQIAGGVNPLASFGGVAPQPQITQPQASNNGMPDLGIIGGGNPVKFGD